MQDNRGCKKDVEIYFAGYELSRCPRSYVGLNELNMLEAYAFYKKGFLPNSGSWTEQPNKFIEAIKIIDKTVGDIEKAEELRAKNGRQKH